MLLKNGADKTCTIQGCHIPSICLKKKKKANNPTVSAKCTKVKHNKMKYPCIVSFFGGHNSPYNTIPSKTNSRDFLDGPVQRNHFAMQGTWA